MFINSLPLAENKPHCLGEAEDEKTKMLLRACVRMFSDIQLSGSFQS